MMSYYGTSKQKKSEQTPINGYLDGHFKKTQTMTPIVCVVQCTRLSQLP